MSADPIALMTPPPESLSDDAGVDMAAGDRPSSDIDAYGGIVSSISLVCMQPAASAIVAPTINAARADFRLRVTSFVSRPSATVSARDRGFNARPNRWLV
jgi:hypothetical protein